MSKLRPNGQLLAEIEASHIDQEGCGQMNTVPKIYFDNDLNMPAGLSVDEMDSWRCRILGAASCHIPPDIWNRLRKEAEEDMLKWRAQRCA